MAAASAEPIADRGFEEIAFGEAMAGIVEAEHGQAPALRPGRKRERLGACHVGQEAGKPDEAEGRAFSSAGKAIGQAARAFAAAEVEELRFGCAHLKNLVPCRR